MWVLRAYSDSDWAGDPDDRKSITGFCIFFNGCLISWKSRGQKTVTLSSSKAKYVAVADVCTEILFIKMILEFLGLKIELSITVVCDNVGAIFIRFSSTNYVQNTIFRLIFHRYTEGMSLHTLADYFVDDLFL